TARESYRRTHEWIQTALLRLDVAAVLASGCRKAGPGQCFVGHEESDLLWNGQKIAGAAQRRTRWGLLIQGSVQPPLPLTRRLWQKAMCEVGPERGARWSNFSPDRELLARVGALATQKYSQADYNRKR